MNYKLQITFILFLFIIVSCNQAYSPMVIKQAKASRNLGEAYLLQGKNTRALIELLKSEKLYPKDPITQNDLGLAYMGKEKYDLAIAHFQKALELKPDYPSAQNNLGSAYLANQQWDLAIPILKEVADNLLYASPQRPLANLGWAYFQKKEYGTSEKYYRKALELDSSFFIALLGIGRTQMAVGNIFEAHSNFNKAAKLLPDNPELLFEMGRVYRLTGNYDLARSTLLKAIKTAESKNPAIVKMAMAEIVKIDKLQYHKQ
ncbi:MAG: tetratricopeptide repeat protein [Bacteroidetes bacterium]|nr:tetratricopeptide repeat protein [Bacteroidota bacterium]